MEAVADETINTEEMAAAAESAAASQAEEPVAEEPKAPPKDDFGLPEGFEMPDLSDLDAMMKEAGL